VGPNFIIIFRLSMLDLVEGGSTTWDEVVQLAQAIEQAGAASSTPASAGTRRAFPPSPPRCRAPRLPG
jgi:2,4-dienoyl-CoA reductase-like NADH-dependent reductase (Old Yellow Enzyme family)